MVLESRLAELLQGQAKKFIHGFNAEHLNLGLLSGFLELRHLALNPEPIDELMLGSDIPFVLKAGTLSSAMLQLSLMQGELEIVVDRLDLVMTPACKWLSREEVYQHRTNEMERLEFVHMRSQSQRRSLEKEMFRKLFSDYLSRIKITVKNVHVRLEVEESRSSLGHPLALGMLIESCEILPVDLKESQELLLAETVQMKGFLFYQDEGARLLVPWDVYHSTRSSDLGIFQKISQAEFVASMDSQRQKHLAMPTASLLLPSTDVQIKMDLKSQALFTDCHVENCLTLEVVICLQNPSRLRVTAGIVEGFRWLVRRTLDFQMWPFLHALHGKPANGLGRWHVLRSFIGLKRRIQSNAYSLQDAIRMRIDCKEYIKLYKKKFNGPQSSFHWRRGLAPLTAEDATRLGLIELSYPAEKLVNFRMMAQTEMKTETSMNSFAKEGAREFERSPRSQAWQVRELTPIEQLHLHGQHGFGTNIFRGLPPPPSNLKVKIDLVALMGLWWVCKLGASEESWAAALDSGKQPARLLLVDSISDNSVFATVELRSRRRPVSLRLARSEAAFAHGAPSDERGGGTGREEWCSMMEFHGDVCCWGQVKTVPMTASHSPWDLFCSLKCGATPRSDQDSFGRVTPLEEVMAHFPSLGSNMLRAESGGEPYLRMNLPLRMRSGQEGPFLELLRWCLAPGGGSQSILACLGAVVRSGYDLAALRLHVSLPPLFLQGVNCTAPPLHLPPFDAACHVENGGLVDGYVVGLHNLYNFANLVASMPKVQKPKSANVVPCSASRRQTHVQPLSLQFLSQAPPLLLALGAVLAASAVVLAGGRRASASHVLGHGEELLKGAKANGLVGLADRGAGELTGVTLIPTLLAVMLGRRALYERLQAPEREDQADPSEVYKFFAATLHVLLAMGFPVHRCSLSLAAWAGSVELLEVLARDVTPGVELMSWAARGSYANPSREVGVEVVQWLIARKGDPEERDAAGRSVLDWACWAGAENLASFLLRRQRLPSRPEPLLLATAARSRRLVRLLLKAAGDPHAVPPSSDGNSCGALMLAVRCCEFELACEVLRSSCVVNVDLALGRYDRLDGEEKLGLATRATIMLVESLRRFASGLQRPSVEEVSVAGMRSHLPGPHPDENLYTTSNMPLGDVLHPWASLLSTPMHRVPLDLRPGFLPMPWLRRPGDVWAPARQLVECLLDRSWRCDEALLARVSAAMPSEVQQLARRLTGGQAAMLPTLLSDVIPERRRGQHCMKEMYGLPVLGEGGKLKLPANEDPAVEELERAGVYEEKPLIPNVADALTDTHEEVSELPSIRVLVLGAAGVGKSLVTKILAQYLDLTYEEDDGPTRLRHVKGTWPTSGAPVVEVHLWDVSSAAMALPQLATDPDAATFCVALEGSEALQLAKDCVAVPQAAPRRALLVNVQSASLPHVHCDLTDEMGQLALKQAFGKIMAEMVGQIEAREEASERLAEGPWQPRGEGDFRQVLVQEPPLRALRGPPVGRRAFGSRLRGASCAVDPTAASLAWQAVLSTRSTLPHEVQGLTGSSPSTSSWRAAVAGPALRQSLRMGQTGAIGENLSETLRRALIELSMICPLHGSDDVLVPSLAEKVSLGETMLRQLMDAQHIFVRLQRSRDKRASRPSLRRALQKFLASRGRLRYFAMLEGEHEGFVLALDNNGTDGPDAGLADLLAARDSLQLSFLVVMAQPEHWDVLCNGPSAALLWRSFAAPLPTPPGLTRLNEPKWALGAPQGQVVLSMEELAPLAWLLCGASSKDVRERLVLRDRAFSALCCALCGSSPRWSLEEPAEEFEIRLLLRRWRELPYFLQEASRSAASTATLGFSLRRFCRDFDLLHQQGAEPLPWLVQQGEEVCQLGSKVSTLAVPSTPSLHAWLAICKPLALWHEGSDAILVVKALQKAASTSFSEHQNFELRESLRDQVDQILEI